MSELTLAERENLAKNKKIYDNSLVVSNIIELTTSVVIKIAGKDISDTIGQESVNRNMLSNLICNRIKQKLLSKE